MSVSRIGDAWCYICNVERRSVWYDVLHLAVVVPSSFSQEVQYLIVVKSRAVEMSEETIQPICNNKCWQRWGDQSKYLCREEDKDRHRLRTKFVQYNNTGGS